jgi:biotin synthase-like enzyme
VGIPALSSLCTPGTNCAQVSYTALVGLDMLAIFRINMPTFTTVVAAKTIGMTGLYSLNKVVFAHKD